MKPGEPVPAGRLLDGRYRVNRVIGQGGMGRVYLANDTRLANRPVAVKEMMVGTGEQEKKAIEDFQREANVLASLSHPGIPNLFDNFVENGRHYLVMEFVAGGDLQHTLDKLGPGARIPEAKVLRWARQILDVLVFLHAQKPPIIYRDFKPGNIMIDHNGRAMLIDFGIARFLPPGGRGTQIGSVGYAPPEQYMGKAEPRSDLYSLAATTHHLLTGRDPQVEPPFSFPPVRKLVPEVSVETERVVMRALERDIAKRPASAREMLDALPLPAEHDAPMTTASSHLPSATSTVPTIVLTNPVQGAAAAAPKKPSGAGNLAHIPTRPGIEAPAARSRPPSRPSASAGVSPTAKTQDLPKRSGSPGPVAPVQTVGGDAPLTRHPGRGSKPAAHGHAAGGGNRAGTPRTLRPAGGQSNGRPAAHVGGTRSGPRLIAKADRAEFAVAGQRAVIGRAAGAASSAAADGADIDIDLSALKRGAERVSRHHAEIIKLGRDYFIRDLGSLNGTYIMGRGRLGRDQLYKLNDRDEVVVGGAILEFRKS